MGLTPQAGPSYMPSLAEMKSGPNVVMSGFPSEQPSRDRSYTNDSYAGDLNKAPEFTSSRDDEMDLGPRIRTSSMGEGAIETRDLNAVKVLYRFYGQVSVNAIICLFHGCACALGRSARFERNS